ncbi:hypothetical protein GCM10007063_10530 [Lentibacillus kapialis]|uniref:Regulatory protein YycH domain-containing protein n=1 Tax=Lentibacillus kapialis TaxID=340214 RepID=A0A917PSE3_9BACI|nr:two-component system activity regulator YycH [Lentibacillus kapialis]GGJ89766.1 hypothetical protein GCM10007063_10530 [Lentibacillus kapialis]
MQLETVKSFILWVLVGISFVLSFALWSYRPNFEELPQNVVEESTSLGGSEKSIKELIEPDSIIFENDNTYYGFSNPADRNSLYQDMHKWSLYEFRTSSANGTPSGKYRVEVIFPEVVPMELADDLFTFNGDINMPGWGFKRLFFTFNQDTKTMNVTFLSDDGNKQAMATVNNSEKYAQLWEYLTTFEGLSKYIRTEGAEGSIYVPGNQQSISSKSIAVEKIDPKLMVDTLFTDPDIVRRNRVNENEIYFTDSARGIMRVYTNRRTVEFQNPLQSSYEQMEPAELIDKSRLNINDHQGWTDEYNLMAVNTNASNNKVRYQMYYEGYPIFGSNYSSVIEQQYRETELHQYNRPLFRLVNYLGGDEATKLISGARVIDKLSSSSSYHMDQVYDIKVGYCLTYKSDADAVMLEPAWFMDYNGSWQKIDFSNLSPQQEGGN